MFALSLKQDFTQDNLEGADPRRYQWLGLGLALSSPHGVFVLTLDDVVAEWLQFDLHLCPLLFGVGFSARAMPRSGNWSPYVGLGVNATLAGLGAFDGPDVTISAEGSVIARRNTFDRVGYLEGGIQLAGRHWQAEFGLAVGGGAPPDDRAFFGVWPAMSARYFF